MGNAQKRTLGAFLIRVGQICLCASKKTLVVGQVKYCGCWGGSWTATPVLAAISGVAVQLPPQHGSSLNGIGISPGRILVQTGRNVCPIDLIVAKLFRVPRNGG